MSDAAYHGDLFNPPRPAPVVRPRGRKGRDSAIDAHKARQRNTIATVRAMALAKYYRLGRPISVNDIRQDWDAIGPLAADCRAIGAVFASRDWRKVGQTPSDAPNSNAGRFVGLFVPTCEPIAEQGEGEIARAFRAGFQARAQLPMFLPDDTNKACDAAIATYLAEIK